MRYSSNSLNVTRISISYFLSYYLDIATDSRIIRYLNTFIEVDQEVQNTFLFANGTT